MDMATNVNPETGIGYGIISANSLDPEIVDEIQRNGRDLGWEEYRSQVFNDVMADETISADDKEDGIDRVLENDRYYDDEPTHEFDIECPGYGRVKGRTTWLGGALMVWIFESPFSGLFRLCSPCVPGACDLDSPADPLRDNVGCIGYDVPADWRYAS
jgi:hypothetical protein